MTAIALIATGCGLGYVVPKFGAIYAEMYTGDVALPVLTQIAIALAPFGWVAFGVVGALVVVGKDIALPSRKLPNWPYIIVLCAVSAGVTLALFLPLIVTIGKM